MANYLPVLLVSVTNAAPDDTFVTTQPRAQVDYLSHEWQEEDVWKSWRNMTRQKNEIANGVRLENASWRTWWKQRNKLKTVTPETLNWLKDSDVTWLYGPLHTAIDYKPPPKPPAISESLSASDHKYPPKPILKHRSIGQLLASDFPTSPIFSPAESEDEDEEPYSATYEGLDFVPTQFPKRPTLQHTKSDTHITRWGANRAFRKDSPPRVDPPGQHNAHEYFPKVSATGPVRTSLSQDSNSSTSQSGERTAKKKHISFNTFVEQCIAIEKPKRSSSFYEDGMWASGRNYDDDDDGYDEDQESSPEGEVGVNANWDRQRISESGGSDSDSPYEDEEEGIIEMRTSYRNTPKKKAQRSQSKVSNASSSSSVSTASSSTNSTTNSSSPSRSNFARSTPLARRASSSTYRPRRPLIRTSATEHVHVTIAPIAPTVLKTTGAWEENFGDDGAGSDDGFGWRERLWTYNKGKKLRGRTWSDDENQGSDGTPVELVYVPPFNSRYSCCDAEEIDEETLEIDEDTYDEDLEEDFSPIMDTPRRSQVESDVYHHRSSVIGSVGFEDYSEHAGSPDGFPSIPIPIPHSADDSSTIEAHQMVEYSSHGSYGGQSIPRVVVMEQSHVHRGVHDEDEFDIFSGPDLGEDYMGVSSTQARQAYSARAKVNRGSNERPSRSVSRTASSRSRSKSRTPSPMLQESTSSSKPSLESSTATLLPSSRPSLRRTSSSSSTPNSPYAGMVPTRGRSISHQDLLQASRSQSSSQSNSRGRSSTRTPPSSAWDSSSSPLGSISPDASPSHAVAAYVGGGRLESKRDSEKDSRRGRESGRDRTRGRSQTTDKHLNVSLSASPEPPRRVMDDDSCTISSHSPWRQGPPTEVSISTCSSTSSTKTIMPQEEQESREAQYMHLAEEELRRKTMPTPSNSPIFEMRAPIGELPRTVIPAPSVACPTPTTATPSRTPTQTFSPTTSPTPTKTRPPPLVPSPSHTAPPSTSYTAVSSPSPTSPKGVASPHLMTTATVLSATPAPATLNESRPSLHRSQDSDSSIMNKAAEMVNTAGAFFGLWNSHA